MKKKEDHREDKLEKEVKEGLTEECRTEEREAREREGAVRDAG